MFFSDAVEGIQKVQSNICPLFGLSKGKLILYIALKLNRFFICFILIWLFNSSCKIYISNSHQVFVRGIASHTSLPMYQFK